MRSRESHAESQEGSRDDLGSREQDQNRLHRVLFWISPVSFTVSLTTRGKRCCRVTRLGSAGCTNAFRRKMGLNKALVREETRGLVQLATRFTPSRSVP
jgi:hypothetical protein